MTTRTEHIGALDIELPVEEADPTGDISTVTPGLVETVIAELTSPTYRAMTTLVYRAGLRPQELATLHRHQFQLRPGPGQLVVCGQADPAANRIIDLDEKRTDQLRAWIALLNPDPIEPLFPTRWHPGWRTALALTGTRHGYRRLTPEQIRRAGLTRRWATDPDTPRHMAAIVGLHPTTNDRKVA